MMQSDDLPPAVRLAALEVTQHEHKVLLASHGELMDAHIRAVLPQYSASDLANEMQRQNQIQDAEIRANEERVRRRQQARESESSRMREQMESMWARSRAAEEDMRKREEEEKEKSAGNCCCFLLLVLAVVFIASALDTPRR